LGIEGELSEGKAGAVVGDEQTWLTPFTDF
jgi:hypothetical protein